MIKFERYRHIHDLFVHYANQENHSDILDLLNNGIPTPQDTEELCRFTWKIAELVNSDEHNTKPPTLSAQQNQGLALPGVQSGIITRVIFSHGLGNSSNF